MELQPDTEILPPEWRDVVTTKPLPWNMQPGKNEGRRSARARALARQLEEDPEVLYADAALPKYRTQATAAVITIDTLVTCASVRTTQSIEAEEVAVALALTHPRAGTIVAGSKKAYASSRKGRVSPAAHPILSKRRPLRRALELVWVPTHSKVEGNELADHHAREVSVQADNEPAQLRPVTSYREITEK